VRLLLTSQADVELGQWEGDEFLIYSMGWHDGAKPDADGFKMQNIDIKSYCRMFVDMNIQAAAMNLAAHRASELLKSLANRHRLLIVCQLIEGERSVGELGAFLGVRDSTVSQHLALLRKDGVVTARRDGQTIWYSIASEPALKVIETLYNIYCAPQPLCTADSD
jgi:DNA-binding transcriptional ArsR family regulator